MLVDEELKKIWQDSPPQEVIKFEKSRLILDLKNHTASTDNYINRQNRISIVVLILFVLYEVIRYNSGAQMFIESGVIILVCLLSLYRALRLRSQNKKLINSSLNVKEQLEKYKMYFEREKYFRAVTSARLFLLVVVGFCIENFIYALLSPEPKWAPFFFITMFWIGCYALTNDYAKRTSRIKFDPIIAKIDAALKELEEA